MFSDDASSPQAVEVVEETYKTLINHPSVVASGLKHTSVSFFSIILFRGSDSRHSHIVFHRPDFLTSKSDIDDDFDPNVHVQARKYNMLVEVHRLNIPDMRGRVTCYPAPIYLKLPIEDIVQSDKNVRKIKIKPRAVGHSSVSAPDVAEFNYVVCRFSATVTEFNYRVKLSFSHVGSGIAIPSWQLTTS